MIIKDKIDLNRQDDKVNLERMPSKDATISLDCNHQYENEDRSITVQGGGMPDTGDAVADTPPPLAHLFSGLKEIKIFCS